MSNVYTLKVIKYGQVIQRKQINAGTRKGIAATVLQAEANVTYVLQAPDGENPIAKIITKQVGKDLHLSVEDGDIKQPQIIIEGYADYEQSTAFASALKLGGMAYFNAENGSLFSRGAEAGTATLTAPAAETASGISPWLWAAAGTVALAAAAKSSSKSNTTTADTSTAALSKITTYAAAGTGTAPTASDYNDAGFKDVTTNNVGAFNSAITAAKTDNTIKVTAVVTAYSKILAEANGTSADATSTDPLLSDYQALGVQLANTLTDTQKTNYLSLLNDIVKGRLVADVNTVTKLNALSSIAEKVILIAAGNTSSATALTATDFQTIGMALTIPNSMLITAIEASANDGSGINSLASIKAIDTAYSKISTAADGTKANAPTTAKLTVSDLTELGLLSNYDANGATGVGGTISGKAVGTGGQQTAALNLLNDVIDGKATASLGTAADINKISILVDKVMDAANGINTSAVTATDLTSLGLTSVTTANYQKIITNISSTASTSGAAVDSLTELQALVGKAVVQTYAEDQSSQVAAPTLQDYKDSGLTSNNVTWTENLKTGVNSVLAAKHTYSLVPDIALNYQAILDEATNGVANTHTNPTATQYTSVLLTAGHVFEGGVAGNTANAQDNALSLLNEVVAHKTQLGVDTVAELESIATIVDHLINTTASTNTTTNLITSSELTTLGLGNAGNSYLANFNQTNFNSALRATIDTGAGIHLWSDLQTLVNSNS
jgi:hypothetical protein